MYSQLSQTGEYPLSVISKTIGSTREMATITNAIRDAESAESNA